MTLTFITEKQTETLLEQETRNITMPDGSIRSLTNFKDIWIGFDKLATYCSFTEEELIESVVINADERNITFEMSFTESIGYMYQHLKYICDRKINERIAHIENVLKNLEGKASNAFNQMS